MEKTGGPSKRGSVKITISVKINRLTNITSTNYL